MVRCDRLLGIMVLLLGACAGSHEYECPDPVGKIIMDDCEVYRTKYEALKVELGASFAGLGVKTSLGQSSLRDPTELIQVLAHRTHALCRDFNACRVPPLEYRQRREQTDRVFTAVSTIQEQLKAQLDAESKARLVQQLVQVLSEDTGSSNARPAHLASSTVERPQRRSGGSYSSWIPWYDTRLLPPQPRAVPGLPVLAGVDLDIDHYWRREGNRGTAGYRPRVTLYLLGKVDPDDLVSVDWGGRSTDCPVSRGERNGLAVVSCQPPKTFYLTTSTFTVKATFRRGSDGKSALIGQRSGRILSRHEEGTVEGALSYGLDQDALAREGRLIFRPVGGLPPELEQPSLLVVLKVRKYRPATARCWVDGKVATPGIEGSRYGGQEGTWQDRPRYRTVRPGVSEGVADPHVEWRRYDFPLPFAVKRGTAALPEGMKPWPLAGRWRCVVSVEGEPVRELTFRIGADGKPDAHPRQLERPEAAWLVETKVLRNPIEAEIR